MLASQNIVIILCGNKKDLDADREVTFLEASRFAQENGKITGDYLIISIKTSNNSRGSLLLYLTWPVHINNN